MYAYEYRVVCRLCGVQLSERRCDFLRPCLRICIDLENLSTSDYEIINIHIIFFIFLPEQLKCGPLLICRYAAIVRTKMRTEPGIVILLSPSPCYYSFVLARFTCISGRGPLNYWKTDPKMYVSLSAVDFRWRLIWPALWKNRSTVGKHNERASTIIVYVSGR